MDILLIALPVSAAFAVSIAFLVRDYRRGSAKRRAYKRYNRRRL
jgi:hypothetical protein